MKGRAGDRINRQYNRPDPDCCAVEHVFGVAAADFCGKAKGERIGAAKEALIVTGRRLGATVTALARLTGLNVATVSRRHDAGIKKMKEAPTLGGATSQVIETYERQSRRSDKSSI